MFLVNISLQKKTMKKYILIFAVSLLFACTKSELRPSPGITPNVEPEFCWQCTMKVTSPYYNDSETFKKCDLTVAEAKWIEQEGTFSKTVQGITVYQTLTCVKE